MSKLPDNPENWPEALRALFEERSAILEYEAKLPRHIAERKAKHLVAYARQKENNEASR